MEPFVCDFCRRSFVSSQDRDAHVAASHPNAEGAQEEVVTAAAESLPTGTPASGQSGTTPPRGTGGATTP